MDNKLIIERKNLRDEMLSKTSYFLDLKCIERYLNNFEECFEKEESIEALKKIKNYLLDGQNYFNNIEKRIADIDKELSKNCLHEICIFFLDFNDDVRYSVCPICQSTEIHRLKKNDKFMLEIEINNDDHEKHFSSYYHPFHRRVADNSHQSKPIIVTIQEIIYEMILKNENSFDAIENYLKNAKIKSYRRCYDKKRNN